MGRREKKLLLLWLVVNVILFGLLFLRQFTAAHGFTFLNIVPEHNYLLYLRTLAAILFGYGLMVGTRLALRQISRFARGGSVLKPAAETMALITVSLIVTAAAYPSYTERYEFKRMRASAEKLANDVIPEGVPQWMRKHTRPTDVFLASGSLGLYVIGPAGRKVVALSDPYFSNPYVNFDARSRARERMWSYLLGRDCAQFLALASQYDVSYVMSCSGSAHTLDFSAPNCLEVELETDGCRIHRIAYLSRANPHRR